MRELLDSTYQTLPIPFAFIHWLPPPVSALARSGGPRKMSQSPVSHNSNIETRMDTQGYSGGHQGSEIGVISLIFFMFLGGLPPKLNRQHEKAWALLTFPT